MFTSVQYGQKYICHRSVAPFRPFAVRLLLSVLVVVVLVVVVAVLTSAKYAIFA